MNVHSPLLKTPFHELFSKFFVYIIVFSFQNVFILVKIMKTYFSLILAKQNHQSSYFLRFRVGHPVFKSNNLIR
jgi:hypothetical protein